MPWGSVRLVLSPNFRRAATIGLVVAAVAVSGVLPALAAGKKPAPQGKGAAGKPPVSGAAGRKSGTPAGAKPVSKKPVPEPAPKSLPPPPPPTMMAKFDELRDLVDESQLKVRSQVQQVLVLPAASPDQLRVLDQYYKRYALARWTLHVNRHSLREFRDELRRDFDRAATSAETHNFLTTLVLGYLNALANNANGTRNFSPAVRYNAMYAIGELNSQEPPTRRDAGVPLPAALPILLGALEDQAQLDVVRMAALCGVVRHCAIGISDAQVRDGQVVPALLRLATAAAPPAGRPPEAHAWMRATAVEGLVSLKGVRDRAAIIQVLGQMVNDDSALPVARYEAARSLGMVDYQGVQGLRPSELVIGLGKTASMVLRSGRLRLAPLAGDPTANTSSSEDEEEEDTSSDDSSGEEEDSGSQLVSEESVDEMAARHLLGVRRAAKTGLNAVLVGLEGTPLDTRAAAETTAPKGVASIATSANDKKLLDALSAPIKTLMTSLDDAALKAPDLLTKVDAAAKEVDAVLAAAGIVPAAATPQTAAAPPAQRGIQ